MLIQPSAPIREAIVLCGGLGIRLRAVVNDVPKPMAPIRGRPFLEYVLAYLAGEGVTRVIMAVGYRREGIMSHFGDRWLGLDIDYSVETEPLGTGGGLRRAMGRLEGPAGLVVNGDSLLLAPLAPLARCLESGADLALTACRRADTAGCGVCVLDGERLSGLRPGAAGTPGLVNAGVYAARAGLFDALDLPEAFSFEAEVLALGSQTLDIRVVISAGEFIDIGLPRTYAAAQDLLPPNPAGGGGATG